jgi:hypothetical protein
MQDLSKLTKAQLLALIAQGSADAPEIKVNKGRKTAKGKTPKRALTVANVTEAFTLTRDPRSDEFGVEYGILAFCDANGNALVGKLAEDDTLGRELIAEIKDYAKANAVGRSRIRYNRKLNAWTGRMGMFPARLRDLAGITDDQC